MSGKQQGFSVEESSQQNTISVETETANNQSQPAWLWMCFIAMGAALEFAVRYFGFRNNPSGLWLDFAPLLTTVIAATLIIFAIFKAMRAWSEQELASFRNSLLVLLTGTSMLVCSMVFKSIIRMLFEA
jgi:magnesium-transporting ATPase (P-type)